MSDAEPAPSVSSVRIGEPTTYISGQFAGRTIRTQLSEIQKADLGRKYAKVDRRPLDPPPVVHLQIFEVFDAGTANQSEREIENYDAVQTIGVLGNVDLFPVPPFEPPSRDPKADIRSTLAAPSQSAQPPAQGPTYYGAPPPAPIPTHLAQDQGAIATIDGYEIKEHTKQTPALVGATFVQPFCVDLKGKKALVFVFADLAVKMEGTFVLRYRTFDLHAIADGQEGLSIQAECFGGPFRVYSTKEFPGLQASTELTKHLARWGVRLNIREAERKRRKPGDNRSRSSSLGAISGPQIVRERNSEDR